MNNIEVSICIPVFGVENYITACLKSVLQQTLIDKIEIILVDDCTPDKSIDIATKLLQSHHNVHSQLIKHEKNKGLAAARNTGLAAAHGKYVIFLDSDDWVEPDYIELLYKTAENGNYDITGCDYISEYENHREIVKENLVEDSTICLKRILRNCQGIIWTKLICKDLFSKNNIRWDEGLDMGEDLLICTKLFSKAEKIGYVNKALHHYRRFNPNSFCNDISRMEKKNKQLMAVAERITEILSPYQKYDNELLEMKLKLKQILILTNKIRKVRRSMYKIYPEAYEVRNNSEISLLWKLLFGLLEKKLYCIVDLLLKLKHV